MSTSFSHLHGHTFHSNWNGPDALSSPDDIVKRAKAIGLTDICITDHASISGVPDFVDACKKHGIKPLVGSELYACSDPAWRPSKQEENDGEASEEGKGKRDYSHVVSLARNWDGFLELCKLISRASGEPNFYRRPRNSFDDLKGTTNLVFTSACAGGLLNRPDYESVCVDLHKTLGPDRFFLEIQPHVDAGQKKVNLRALELAQKHGIKLVAAQDFHYANPGDNKTHEVLLAMASKDVMSNPQRWRYPVDDLYIKSPDEMLAAFAPWIKTGILPARAVAEAMINTSAIAASLDFKWQDMPVSLPQMSPDPNTTVMEICARAMKGRGLDAKPEYVKRLTTELRVLIDAGIVNYFLILHDICKWCRDQNIMVGPGRGSAGGSLVAYLLGITTIDPIKHGLLFERFYRAGRVDLPDIDSDFEDERRGEVLQYIERRFGRENVATVANYTRMKAKGALKDVARVFEVDFQEMNRVTNAIAVPDIQIDDEAAEREHAEQVMKDPAVVSFFARYPQVEQHVRSLILFMKGTGQHAAGVVIAGEPVENRAAIMHGKEGARVVCWDKWTIEKFGLMKLDILGLRTMTILRRAAENVKRRHGHSIRYEHLPLDDPQALSVFDRGDTTAVFQCESHGMRKVFKACNVDRFSIIADVISLYRPGPMQLIDGYTAVQAGKAPLVFDHPVLEPILRDTFGVLVYQEQMMSIFVEVGGFSYADADKMRKIVGKKLGPDEFRKHEADFVNGAIAKGIDQTVASRIFSKMVDFAGYAFNKSHAVAYAIIAYWCAYMKAKYPAEFWAAHLTSTENEEKLRMATEDALKAGVRLEMPNVNLSHATSFVPVDDKTILAPLSAIMQVGAKASELIVGARLGEVDGNGLRQGEARPEAKKLVSYDATNVKAGGFTDQSDFERRVYRRIVNKKVIENLRRAGALPWDMPDAETVAANRRELLADIYREIISVNSSDKIIVDTFNQPKLEALCDEMVAMATKARAKGAAMPWVGSRARIMVVFNKPSWRQAKANTMNHQDDLKLKVVKKVLAKAFGYDAGDLYVTSLYRWDGNDTVLGPYKGVSIPLLTQEIELLKPPLILALGKEPVELLTGKTAGAMHGKVAMYGKIPVVCGIDPWMVYTDAENEVIDSGKLADFEKITDAIQDLYN